jgi:hypothetical protein
MSLIQCFSNVVGHKEAQELVIDLNSMKSNQSKDFYIYYNKFQNYEINDTYLVVGNVTKEDWGELDMDNDFMQADLIGN